MYLALMMHNFYNFYCLHLQVHDHFANFEIFYKKIRLKAKTFILFFYVSSSFEPVINNLVVITPKSTDIFRDKTLTITTAKSSSIGVKKALNSI